MSAYAKLDEIVSGKGAPQAPVWAVANSGMNYMQEYSVGLENRQLAAKHAAETADWRKKSLAEYADNTAIDLNTMGDRMASARSSSGGRESFARGAASTMKKKAKGKGKSAFGAIGLLDTANAKATGDKQKELAAIRREQQSDSEKNYNYNAMVVANQNVGQITPLRSLFSVYA